MSSSARSCVIRSVSPHSSTSSFSKWGSGNVETIAGAAATVMSRTVRPAGPVTNAWFPLNVMPSAAPVGTLPRTVTFEETASGGGAGRSALAPVGVTASAAVDEEREEQRGNPGSLHGGRVPAARSRETTERVHERFSSRGSHSAPEGNRGECSGRGTGTTGLVRRPARFVRSPGGTDGGLGPFVGDVLLRFRAADGTTHVRALAYQTMFVIDLGVHRAGGPGERPRHRAAPWRGPGAGANARARAVRAAPPADDPAGHLERGGGGSGRAVGGGAGGSARDGPARALGQPDRRFERGPAGRPRATRRPPSSP